MTHWRLSWCACCASYRQMIDTIGESDPTTRHMLVGIMAVEEQHADDMRGLLA
ncbi:MAG: hypothetical protein RI925_1302 [Pseudomonadota bacterium]|jgi:bacterioferritin